MLKMLLTMSKFVINVILQAQNDIFREECKKLYVNSDRRTFYLIQYLL